MILPKQRKPTRSCQPCWNFKKMIQATKNVHSKSQQSLLNGALFKRIIYRSIHHAMHIYIGLEYFQKGLWIFSIFQQKTKVQPILVELIVHCCLKILNISRIYMYIWITPIMSGMGTVRHSFSCQILRMLWKPTEMKLGGRFWNKLRGLLWMRMLCQVATFPGSWHVLSKWRVKLSNLMEVLSVADGNSKNATKMLFVYMLENCTCNLALSVFKLLFAILLYI